MPKDSTPRFESSADLERLASQAVESLDSLADCKLFKIAFLFSNRKLNGGRVAGKCTLLPPAVRHKAKFDYLILIDRKAWDAATKEDKGRILIHELSHIKQSEVTQGREIQPAIRRHEGDFCELPEHDAWSRGLYEKAEKQLTLLGKFPRQETIA